MMRLSNQELQDAIAVTSNSLQNSDGYTGIREMMQKHLKELLEEQVKRAKNEAQE